MTLLETLTSTHEVSDDNHFGYYVDDTYNMYCMAMYRCGLIPLDKTDWLTLDVTKLNERVREVSQ